MKGVTGVLALTILTLSSCQIEKVAIPHTDAQLALHGVLSPTAFSQVVLLERTRNGTVQLTDPPFDLSEPVASDAGIAEFGALVSLTTPDGSTINATEDFFTRLDHKGKGIYRFPILGSTLTRGGAYRLHVISTQGEQLSAVTYVPSGAAVDTSEKGTFDRSRDTLFVEWPVTPGARSYYVRIETPYGPRAFFTQDTHVRLPGELRNANVTSLPRVFIPGFPQAVTVSAVDSNFYDWYRTHNETISGVGLVSRVAGGTGVFGSLVRVRFAEYTVTQPKTQSYEGEFRVAGTELEQRASRYLGFTIFLESKTSRADQGDAVSGRYEVRPRFGYSGCLQCGMLGTIKNGAFRLAMLSSWTARDTVDLFVGQLRGDTLDGSFAIQGGAAKFARQH